ncbi:MAG: hypothetical protein H0X13_07090 [Ramlibacter sp.]|nr:hypothetical protein [Ramlibacter sp.]
MTTAPTRLSLVGGEFLVNLSRGAMTLSLGFFLYRLTGNVWAFALASITELFVALLLRNVSANAVDGLGARRVMMVACLSLAAILGAVSLAGDLYGYNVWLALAVALLLSIIRVFQNAAGYAAVVVYAGNRIESINSALSVALQAGQLAGVIVAGATLELMTLNTLCLLTGLSYLGAALFYRRLPVVARIPRPAVHPGAPDRERIPLHLKLYGVLATFDFALAGVFNLLLAPAVAAAFGGAPRWMTILDVNYTAGAIFSGMLLVAFSARCRSFRWFPSLFSSLMAIACFLALYHQKGVLLYLVVFLFGFASTSSYMFWTSISQSETPAQLSGRVGAMKGIFNSLALALASMMLTIANIADQSLLLPFALAFCAMTLVGALLIVEYLSRASRSRPAVAGP